MLLHYFECMLRCCSLESTFSLNNLAVVNVKDRESGPAVADQLLKLLVFPEQRQVWCCFYMFYDLLFLSTNEMSFGGNQQYIDS